jgi:hypothetical protein
MYLFGIGAGMEHHIPPQLNAVRSIRGNAKEKKRENWPGSDKSDDDKTVLLPSFLNLFLCIWNCFCYTA